MLSAWNKTTRLKLKRMAEWAVTPRYQHWPSSTFRNVQMGLHPCRVTMPWILLNIAITCHHLIRSTTAGISSNILINTVIIVITITRDSDYCARCRHVWRRCASKDDLNLPINGDRLFLRTTSAHWWISQSFPACNPYQNSWHAQSSTQLVFFLHCGTADFSGVVGWVAFTRKFVAAPCCHPSGGISSCSKAFTHGHWWWLMSDECWRFQ